MKVHTLYQGILLKVQIRVHESTFLMSSHLVLMLLVLESCFQQQDYRFQLVLDIFWLSFQFFQKVLPVSGYLIHFLVFIFSLVGIKKLMNEKSLVTVDCLNLYCQRQKFSQKPLQRSHSLPIPTPAASPGHLDLTAQSPAECDSVQ